MAWGGEMSSEAEYREMLIWAAETVHQNYHTKDQGTWRSCEKDLCDSIARFLDGDYNPSPRMLAKSGAVQSTNHSFTSREELAAIFPEANRIAATPRMKLERPGPRV